MLTRAVYRAGMRVHDPQDLWDAAKCEQREFNLLEAESFNAIKAVLKSGEVRWVHFAPPCKTFSKARRTDRHGSAAVLRWPDNVEGRLPDGSIPRKVAEANDLARRTAVLHGYR